ncbi:hypothetical protein PHYSODRAFT_328096 [Phytophthora sojae]|uniref:Uncharacterized protein n=1 Tax=Phytophthora sojae (strain P6497) TaxID=1094619 RepID=G4Z1S7_PHYSP|nr:hypothetical protein PHYSODRAFT_328096 [Phytophthora sojae]EGZ19925.1 hypothetical protein PHYSODRAFT_328096 [Phytophthora sojae]|eukprot:XP_009522642.1 hypothetical protein PHYSODRAFT_328096 [Phytophthora sojae]
MEQDDEEDFARGREYCDKKAFKLAVMSYVVLIKGCPFAVRGRLTDEGCVRVTSSHLDHSCQPLQHKTPPALIAKAVAATELRNRSSVKAVRVLGCGLVLMSRTSKRMMPCSWRRSLWICVVQVIGS